MCDTQATEPTKEKIAEHIQQREFQIWLRSKFLAAILCGAMAAFLAFINEVRTLGEHSCLWASVLGLIVGGLLGERLVFTLFGVLIAKYLLPNN
ncbi:hypothetical protein [Desulfuromonas thiophila]|nr:hypothetical protein [Desulfuromonas thiophila]